MKKPLSDRRPWLTVAMAHGRALWTRNHLPPGDLVDIDEQERRQRTMLLDRAARYGPVFKGLMERRLTVCVVGHERGRRLLKDHAADLRPVTIQLESLFPNGFMRGMQGEVHRDYRRALVHGIGALEFDLLRPRIEGVADAALAAYADALAPASPQAWAGTLAQIAASALITIFFGPDPAHSAHARLLAAYHRLGPHGVVWTISTRQVEAYQALCAELAALDVDAGGLLGRLRAQGNVDDTLLGNLVYMVELGRYDLRGLLRWISRYAADHPAWLERIAMESASPAGAAGGKSVAEAFVLETLRMDQSERLMRDVRREFVFDGWLIPRGSLVRVCMWEAHKEPQSFPQPFVFDPARFLGDGLAADRFSPFGLDHHHCPLAGPSVEIAVAFLRALARNYVVGGRNFEPAVRGPYHWEPSTRFEVTLKRNGGAAH